MTVPAVPIAEFQDIESQVLKARQRLDFLAEATPVAPTAKTIFDEEVDNYFKTS